MARNGKRNTTEYFDKRIGLEDDSMPMPLAERVYQEKHKICVVLCTRRHSVPAFIYTFFPNDDADDDDDKTCILQNRTREEEEKD